MKIDSHQWVLFGYDLRNIGGLWRMAWRDLLWSQDSRLRGWLDEPVNIWPPRTDAAESAQPQVIGRIRGESVLAEAQELPEELVLSFWLNLPEKAEAELESALALEVRAKSPYPPEDTCYAWRIASRLDGVLRVCVVLVSRSGVMAYLHRFLDADTAARREVWACVDGLYILLPGFGETARERRYAKRLRRISAWLAYSLAISLLLMATPVVLRSIQTDFYREELRQAQEASAEAVRLRNQLAQNNERIQEIQRMLDAAGDPYKELLRLTYLLDDQVWLAGLEYKGDRMRIEGMADNAAELMQLLSGQPGYDEVRAPSAIRRDPRSNQERFVLDVRLTKTGGKP